MNSFTDIMENQRTCTA